MSTCREDPSKKIIDITTPLPDKFEDFGKFKARFEWAVINEIYVPVLVRDRVKFCIAQVFEKFILSSFSNFFSKAFYITAEVNTFIMTYEERNLYLKFIKATKRNNYDEYKANALLVKLKDASNLFTYLDYCRERVYTFTPNDGKDVCGFVSINDTIVPYIIHRREHHFPLFIIRGVKGFINSPPPDTDFLVGWSFRYLIYLCRLLGVPEIMLTKKSCETLTLRNLKLRFSVDTVFAETWPTTTNLSSIVADKYIKPTKRGRQDFNDKWMKDPDC